MKKVVALISNLGFGGAQAQSVILFNGLYRKGFGIRLVVLENRRKELAERLDKGIEVIYVNRNFYFDPLAVLQVRKHVSEGRPDFLVMAGSYPILYGFLMKRIFGLKAGNIAILHNTIPPNLKRALQNRIVYVPSLKRLDHIVFVCNRQREYWMGRYGIDAGKTSVILNGIDIGHFERFYRDNDKTMCRKLLGIPEGAVVIAMNASLWAPKCHEHMVEALYILRKEGLDLFLLIIGDGPMRKHIEELSLERGLSENVWITGYVSDVRPYLMSADISALTSVTETFSMAALESMALGKAMILSDTGGAPEIVDEGVNGYLYTPGNVAELAYSIKKIIESGRYRAMGENAREKARRFFTQEKMVEQYASLLMRAGSALKGGAAS